ncbi:TrbC/VirB2 family protein [Maridesulfovibrio sp.]|uniref:TrbC/VirB2 family protein n=1 Tax=Maridesulfovibrio sp. TaxID=2795000 RepID=UPI0029CA64CF|nr:TrbC/VirB2 family protein [Maridesulfovibrio sp.]
MKRTNKLLMLALAGMMLIPDYAQASTSITDFNTPFETFVGIFTGPVGKYMSIGGIVGVGLTLIFRHDDMTGPIKLLLGVVLAICIVVFGSTLVENTWTFTGAVL